MKTPEADRLNVSAWALSQRSLTLFLMALVAMGGVAAYFHLGQREDPDFTFRIMVIRTFWPGATTEQVDRQITDRLERKLQEVPYYKRAMSHSKPGESLIILELLDSSPPRQVMLSWYQARKKVADIRATLPPEVQGPFFNDEFGDVFGSILAFTAEGMTHAELRRLVEGARLEFLRLPNVAKVELVGVQEERIHVEISHQRLATLGLTPVVVADTLQAQNALIFPGSLETGSESLALHVSGPLNSVEELENLLLRAGDELVRLGDVATMRRGYVEPATPRLRFQGRDAIGLAISMQPRGDVLQLGADLQRTLARLRLELPLGVQLEQVSDQPSVVKSAVNEFMQSLLEAVLIVLLVSFVTLGWRSGLVVAMTIPMVLAGVFLVMYVLGIDLHRISTGALIIALGLLVDDAMIAVEMMARKMEQGWDRLQAASYAYRSTAFPMLTGTLITAAGFLPIATARSSTGEYTFDLFSVVTIALLVSWVAAVVVTPLVGAALLPFSAHAGKSPAGESAAEGVFDTRFYRSLRVVTEACMTHRFLVIVLTLGLFVLGGVGMGMTEKQFFPSSNRVELMVDLWLAEGSSLEATEQQAKRLEAILAQNRDVATFATYVGNGSPRFFLSLDQQLYRNNFAQIIVLTRDLPGRERVVVHLREVLSRDFPGVRGRVTRVPLGPPVSYPVQFRVLGDDPKQLKRLAEAVATMVRGSPVTRDTNIDWGDMTPSLHIEVDQNRARALGVTSSAVARTVAGVTQGLPLTQFREGDRLIDVVLRAPVEERRSLEAMAGIHVPTLTGQWVPLSQVAEVQVRFEEPILWRYNRKLSMTVRADVVDGVQAPDVTTVLDAQLAPLRAQLPPGYRIEAGGAWEENVHAEASIQAGMPMTVAVILVLLMVQLRNLSRTLMVFLTAPLGIVGVAGALLLSGRPFGFVAMLGTIALAGMIMRNTVILVDQIRQDQDAGSMPWEAIRESTVRRFRPIVLTAAAAILAMIPLTSSPLWGPMAFAIMGGLLVATLLTILFVPALYAAWFRVKKNG
ncbi:MAG: efflux RND transporter permease subunit [Magnetococcus sp. DMHC-1]